MERLPEPLSVAEFLKQAARRPVIDVRSPAEYAAGHVPGAHSMPLFNDRERAAVGTLYKQSGREEALLQGLDIVGSKMRFFVEEAARIAPYRDPLLHCWRGGMRSESLAWLLRTAGMQVQVLKGGYKAYRNHALQSLAGPVQLLIVGGETGSGKTDILHALSRMGEQVIDLEGLARHKGSSFGGIGQHSQPTTEQFQNDLFDQWRKLDLRKRVWVEDESFSIGSVQLPYELWEQLKAARMLRVQVPRSARINRLVREYGQQDQEALADAIRRIEKRLSTPRMLQALDDLQNNRLHEVADNLLNYYDRSYGRNMERRDQKSISPVICEKDEPESNARLLQQAAGRLSSTTLNS